MAISEAERHDLHGRLVEALGREAAATLMGYLPPVGWADVATKRDLDALGSDLRAEMADLRTELKTEMADLRTEMATLRGDLRAEIGALGSRLFFQMLGLQISAAALVVAVTRLA